MRRRTEDEYDDVLRQRESCYGDGEMREIDTFFWQQPFPDGIYIQVNGSR